MKVVELRTAADTEKFHLSAEIRAPTARPDLPAVLPALMAAVARWKAGQHPGGPTTSNPVDAVPSATVTGRPITPAQAAAPFAPPAPESNNLLPAPTTSSLRLPTRPLPTAETPLRRSPAPPPRPGRSRGWVPRHHASLSLPARSPNPLLERGAIWPLMPRGLWRASRPGWLGRPPRCGRSWPVYWGCTPPSGPGGAGLMGEVRVAAVLAKVVVRDLRWRVLPAVPVGERGADIDHLVIESGGFSSSMPSATPGQGSGSAAARRWSTVTGSPMCPPALTRPPGLLSAACGLPVPVESLIVTARTKDMVIKQQPDGVAVVPHHQLARWLLPHHDIHTPEMLEVVYEAARCPTTWR